MLKFLGITVERPGLFLGIYFFFGVLLYMYGIRDGSLLIFDVIAGTVFYKLIKYHH